MRRRIIADHNARIFADAQFFGGLSGNRPRRLRARHNCPVDRQCHRAVFSQMRFNRELPRRRLGRRGCCQHAVFAGGENWLTADQIQRVTMLIAALRQNDAVFRFGRHVHRNRQRFSATTRVPAQSADAAY